LAGCDTDAEAAAFAVWTCPPAAFVGLPPGGGDDGGVTGAPLVKDAMATVLGQSVAQVFISVALFLFAVTTPGGNFYYAGGNFRFPLRKTVSIQCFMCTLRSRKRKLTSA